MVGSTLSHYEVLDELGRGGMGIVYRARDIRLDRIVALKVLPSNALAREDDRARFFREARAAAKLQHPHIASIYETDEVVPAGTSDDEPRPFIALEFIDGQDLAHRIAEGPLKLTDAVRIGLEIAQALEAAHEKDIVHRDIKPQNVMLTAKGDVKVLDFGLAKTAASTMLTRAGSTLGTVAYMSPEQAAGEEVDRRTDLWSLGVTLFEMITGRHPFARDYEQAVVYSILNEDPEPVTALRTGVPMGLEWIVDKALAKDRDLRYQTAADFVADLKAVDVSGSGAIRSTKVSRSKQSEATAPTVASGRAHAPSMPWWGWLAVIAGIALGVIGTLMLTGSAPRPDTRVMRLTLDTGRQNQALYTLAASPSGRYIAYNDADGITVRELGTDEEWPIAASHEVTRIVFTPDEQWLFLERPGMILRAPIRGGAPYEVVPVDAVWSTLNVAPGGEIVYESGGSIWRLDLAQGVPEAVLSRDSLIFFDDPFLTRDGRFLLVTHRPNSQAENRLGIYDYPAATLRGELALPLYFPSYLESGHLLFKTDRMHVAPIDLERAELLGPSVPLVEGVVNRGAMSVSDTGHLFYLQQQVDLSTTYDREFETEDWNGEVTRAAPAIAPYESFDVDPTGQRLAVSISAGGGNISVVSLGSGVSRQLTRSGVARDPSWHPSGDSVLFIDVRNPRESAISIIAADGSGQPRTIFETDGWTARRPRLSRDGRYVLFERPTTSLQPTNVIWRLETATGQAGPVIAGGRIRDDARYSPDGRLVAYADRARLGQRSRVWVMRSTFTGEPQDVSREPGWNPRWAPDEQAIYYESEFGIKRVHVIETVEGLVVDDPVLIMPGTGRIGHPWEVLPDGSGILRMTMPDNPENAAAEDEGESDGMIRVVLNWTSVLSEIAPPVQ